MKQGGDMINVFVSGVYCLDVCLFMSSLLDIKRVDLFWKQSCDSNGSSPSTDH